MSTSDGPDDGWGTAPTPPTPPQAPPPPPPPGYSTGYGQPAAAQQTEGTAIAALVCAIGSWVTCIPILAIAAIPLASSARRKIAESGGRLTGENLLTPATIVAVVNLAAWGLLVITVFMVLAFAGS